MLETAAMARSDSTSQATSHLQQSIVVSERRREEEKDRELEFKCAPRLRLSESTRNTRQYWSTMVIPVYKLTAKDEEGLARKR